MTTTLTIIYFSGTGNTAWVVGQLARRLSDLDHAVHTLSCEDTAADDPRIAAADMLGVAFPVYGSFAPHNLRRFLALLPPVDNIPLFVIAVPAIFGGDAAWYAARPLARQGYAPFLYANVCMPNNVYPVPDAAQTTLILQRADAKIEQLVPLIHQHRRHLEGTHLLGWLGGYLQRPGMAWIEKLAQGLWFADASCTHCGLCARLCPANNISLVMTSSGDRFVKFGRHCLFCLRCFHRCPQQAIQFTRLTCNTTRFRRYAGPPNDPTE